MYRAELADYNTIIYYSVFLDIIILIFLSNLSNRLNFIPIVNKYPPEKW